jgi:glucose-6-phosphate isomerase
MKLALPIYYNDKHMRSDLSAAEKLAPREIMDARQELIKLHKTGEQGWLQILDNKKHLAEIKQAAKKFAKFKNLLVIGIGGSDLGAKAILCALRTCGKKTKVHFTGDTTDPDEISAILDGIPWKQTAINVISKSGDTLETMSVFFEAKERLERAVGAKKSAQAIICTTDPEHSALLDLAREKGYATLSIPQNIGGRFSVLTSTGLFPIAMAGVNIDKLLSSASALRDNWLKFGGTSHMIDQFAAYHVAHFGKKRDIHVLFTYSSALKQFSYWYRQTWAESLGKSTAVGPTPVASIGPTDQHSQLQLYQDGPDDKVYTFLNVENFNTKLRVPKSIRTIDALAYAKGHSFADLIHSALSGTSGALADQNKPIGIISIKKIDETSLGSLIIFYEIAVAMAGLMLHLNPFNQPGVEDSKHRVREILTGSS